MNDQAATPNKKFKHLDKLKAGSLIALVYFLSNVFDNRYALQATVSELTKTQAVDNTAITVKLISIEKKLDETSQDLKEALHELRNYRNNRN